MTALDVELAGSTTRTRTRLAGDVAVEQLVPSMVTLVGHGSPGQGTWQVHLPDGRRIPADATLTEAGVAAGAVIYLTRGTDAIDLDEEDRAPPDLDHRTPSQRTSAILPERMTTGRRLCDTARAFAGTQATPEAVNAPALERAVDMWRWGDHRRRLEWMIGRPQLRRTIIIGVTTQADHSTSPGVAVSVAAALAASRADRIVLVDGDPTRAGLTRLTGGRCASIAAVAQGAALLDARFGNDPVTVVGCDLSDTRLPDSDVFRLALDQIRHSAGVVVIDCGPVGESVLGDLCEQTILVTDAPVGQPVRRLYDGRATLVATIPRPGLDRAKIDESLPTAMGSVAVGDDLSGHGLAAMLADGWAGLGATR